MLTYLGLPQSVLLENAEAVTELLRCDRIPLRHLDLSGASAKVKKMSEYGMASMADLLRHKTTLAYLGV